MNTLSPLTLPPHPFTPSQSIQPLHLKKIHCARTITTVVSYPVHLVKLEELHALSSDAYSGAGALVAVAFRRRSLCRGAVVVVYVNGVAVT